MYVWLKHEIKHLPGRVYDTSGLGNVFGLGVTRWGTFGAERENLDHELFGFIISQSYLIHKIQQSLSLTYEMK